MATTDNAQQMIEFDNEQPGNQVAWRIVLSKHRQQYFVYRKREIRNKVHSEYLQTDGRVHHQCVGGWFDDIAAVGQALVQYEKLRSAVGCEAGAYTESWSAYVHATTADQRPLPAWMADAKEWITENGTYERHSVLDYLDAERNDPYTQGDGRAAGIEGVTYGQLVSLFGQPETLPPGSDTDGKVTHWWPLIYEDEDCDLAFAIRNYKTDALTTTSWSVAVILYQDYQTDTPSGVVLKAVLDEMFPGKRS